MIIIMMPTIIGAKTFTRKISIAMITMAAMIATMIEPAFPDALIIVLLRATMGAY
ncbi:MAG TPA: hypothetical protein VLD84_07425 [Nitrososphaeraceae archaeon]|nr:hypothetical protein [Nitrososphaeraceae archaeon]